VTAEADEGRTGLRYVADSGHPGYEQQVITGRDSLLRRALKRGQAALGDQRPGGWAAPVRHVLEHQPGTRPARGGESPRQHPLPGREQRDGEARDRLLGPAEQFRRIRPGHQ
jgi:hypothetical protein